jgi:hypothetical protein
MNFEHNHDFTNKVYFLSLRYSKSVAFIHHVSFGANQPLNYLNWCIFLLAFVNNGSLDNATIEWQFRQCNHLANTAHILC